MDIVRQIHPWDTVYISGPMTGLPEFNRPAFNDMAAVLSPHCKEVLNPARQPDGLTWAQYMRHALQDLAQATVVVVLPGHQDSRGGTLELEIARALDIRRVYHQPQMALSEGAA